MRITYYQTPDGRYVALTDECPHGLQGIVFVGRGGDSPASVAEQLFTPHNWREISAKNVPDE